MKKFLNTLTNGLKSIVASLIDQWFYAIGLLWMFASFLYVGEPHFWTVLGFGIIFTGVQNIVNEIKLSK